MNWDKIYLNVIEANLMWIAALIYIPLEIFFPYEKNRKFFRNEFWQDTFWVASNEAIITYVFSFFRKMFFISLVPLMSIYFSSDKSNYELKKIPLDNDLVIALLIFWSRDFLSWFAHYTAHRFKLLWRNHILHHSSEKIDCLAGFRGYWLDNLYIDTLPMLPLLFLDIPVYWIYIIGFLEINIPFFLHSNIAVPKWKIFKFFPHPHYHRWHHAKVLKFKYGQNFSFYSTTFDRLFGTYYNPEEDPECYGINDVNYPRGIIQRFLYPLNWKKYYKKKLPET